MHIVFCPDFVLCILVFLSVCFPGFTVNMSATGQEETQEAAERHLEENFNPDEEDSEHESDDDLDKLSNWPDEDTARLIEIWKAHEYMYNLRHKWYHRRDKKDAVIQLMAEELKISGEFTI